MNRFAALVCLLCCATLAFAKLPRAQSTAAVARPEFEVASIKPSAGNGSSSIFCHGADAKEPPNSEPALGRCAINRRFLVDIIVWAYGVQRVVVTGGPEWVRSEAFDIQAKAENPEDTSHEKFRLMLQSLLEREFKLAFHRETRQGEGYELTIAKNGPKLEQATGLESPQGLQMGGGKGSVRMVGRAADMFRVAYGISQAMGAPVIDHTGLNGLYDFVLMFTTNPNDLSAPPLSSAIQEQLGLKLEAKKVPYDMFIIDSAERPSQE